LKQAQALTISHPADFEIPAAHSAEPSCQLCQALQQTPLQRLLQPIFANRQWVPGSQEYLRCYHASAV